MSNITIRTATMDDYDTICQIIATIDEHHEAICPDFFQQHPGPSRPRDWLAKYTDSDKAEILIAQIDTKPVGCITLKTISLPDNPRFLKRNMAEIEIIGVIPEYRRTGIATTLLEHAKAWAEERGLKRIQLGVWAANSTALRFYKKQGFKTITARMELNLAN